jgi:hypothetical protein
MHEELQRVYMCVSLIETTQETMSKFPSVMLSSIILEDRSPARRFCLIATIVSAVRKDCEELAVPAKLSQKAIGE